MCIGYLKFHSAKKNVKTTFGGKLVSRTEFFLFILVNLLLFSPASAFRHRITWKWFLIVEIWNCFSINILPKVTRHLIRNCFYLRTCCVIVFNLLIGWIPSPKYKRFSFEQQNWIYSMTRHQIKKPLLVDERAMQCLSVALCAILYKRIL